MAGPDRFPDHLLPFPVFQVHDEGAGGRTCDLTVQGPDGHAFSNALVALYTTPYSYTVAIDQGLTDRTGQLTVYGALAGDTIQASSFDGAYAGAVEVGAGTTYTLTLSPTHAGAMLPQDSRPSPYLDVIPGSEGDTLSLRVHGALKSSLPLNAVVIPGQGGGAPQSTSLAYSAGEQAYVGQVSFAGVGLGSGEARVNGIAGGQWVSLNGDYNLMQVLNGQANELASEDGNLQLYVDPGSLLHSADTYAMIVPTGNVPGPLPEGKQVLGSAYSVRLSGAATQWAKPALLTMYHHPDVMGYASEPALYWWNALTKEWSCIKGEWKEMDQSVSVAVQPLGIYALMGEQSSLIYLPFVLR